MRVLQATKKQTNLQKKKRKENNPLLDQNIHIKYKKKPDKEGYKVLRRN